jgi:hypothetical protein
VKVEWQTAQGSLDSLLEKPPFPGPWVVRVALQAPSGHVIAHDFVEVAALPPRRVNLDDLE